MNGTFNDLSKCDFIASSLTLMQKILGVYLDKITLYYWDFEKQPDGSYKETKEPLDYYHTDNDIARPVLMIMLYHYMNIIRFDEHALRENSSWRWPTNPLKYGYRAAEEAIKQAKEQIKTKLGFNLPNYLVTVFTEITYFSIFKGIQSFMVNTLVSNKTKIIIGGALALVEISLPTAYIIMGKKDEDIPYWQPSKHEQGYSEVMEGFALYRKIHRATCSTRENVKDLEVF